MSHPAARSRVSSLPMALARGSILVAVLALIGCSAPSAGSPGIADASASPAASGSPTTAVSPTTAPTPEPTVAASPAVASAMPTPEASYPDPTPMPTVTEAPTTATAGLRTFPVLPDGGCDGMTVDDPLTLTLDLSQSERDAAVLTDRTDWNVHVVWPAGFTVAERGGQPVLIDDLGETVGRQGDDVTIPARVIYPAGQDDQPIFAEGMLFGRCHRRAVEFAKGSAVRTTDDGLRMRTSPGTNPGSPVIQVLPSDTSLYVLDGPVTDDGRDWYRVDWLDAPSPKPFGWVAAAGLDGTPFIEPATLQCPPAPTVPSEVAAMPSGFRVGCFGEEPLTIRARLVPCECNVDGPFEGMQPSWLMPDYGPDGPWLLIDADAAGPSPLLTNDLFLTRHPDAPSPDAWGGSIVRVTGMFDHPDVADCGLWVGDGPASPGDCSDTFVVIGMEAA